MALGEEHATVWLCIDCTLLHANGEYGEGRPTDEPEPLSALGEGEQLTLGLLAEEHADTCTEADRDEGCDCERDPFRTGRCDGCGSWLAGERHAGTTWWTPKGDE